MSRSVSYASNSAWVLYADYGSGDEYDEAFSDFTDNLRAELRGRFPSLRECDQWLGREDRAVMENANGYIGVSEYCGLASIWAVPKEGSALGKRWCAQIEGGAAFAVGGISTLLVKIGTASNGEAFFERARA